MRIGLDFDGVISDVGEAKVQAAKAILGKNIEPKYSRRKNAVSSGILTDEEYSQIQKEIYKDRFWLNKTKQIEGASLGIGILISRGHEVGVITSRYKDWEGPINEWLTKENITLPIVCVGYGTSKKEEANGLDVFVDDDLDKLEELIGVVPKLFLFTGPYNKEDILPSGIERVNDWRDLLDRLGSYSIAKGL